MKKYLSYLFIVIFVSLLSCSKSGQKALEKGDYYTATMQAIDKLNRDPDNRKSVDVLKISYKYALSDLQKQINIDQKSDRQFKWERVVDAYGKINSMYNRIEDCRVCGEIVSPKAFFAEEDEVIDLAAKERYKYAENQLNEQTREAAREAFESFEKLKSYAPEYKDIDMKLEEALFMASVHVVVEQPRLNARLYDYSYAFFQNQVEDYLKTNSRLNKYVRFYNPSEAETIALKPDHLVRLEFVNFVVGQTRVDSKEQQVISEDSVKTGTIKVRGKTIDVYGKVNARIVSNKKQVRSYGVMSLQVVDYQSEKLLLSRDLSGEFNWFNEWLTYNGDERALTKEQLQQAKNREELPPPPQDLFIEFCKPIYDQFTTEIRRFYSKY